jgi:hypothetical protein
MARPPGEFPSGQRGRAVNPLAQPSEVRILSPPSLPWPAGGSRRAKGARVHLARPLLLLRLRPQPRAAQPPPASGPCVPTLFPSHTGSERRARKPRAGRHRLGGPTVQTLSPKSAQKSLDRIQCPTPKLPAPRLNGRKHDRPLPGREAEGKFKPWRGPTGVTVFETAAFDRSAAPERRTRDSTLDPPFGRYAIFPT